MLVDLALGAGYLLRGLRWVQRRRRLWFLGLLPALITAIVYVTLLLVLAFWVDELAAAATPFAAGWDESWRTVVRVLAGIVIFGFAVLLAAVTFTATTLLIGQPFYEALASKVEESEGGAPPPSSVPPWRALRRAARDGAVTVLHAARFGIPLFFLGFVPGLGQTLIPLVGAGVTGFFLATELTAPALQRRGFELRDRYALLRRHRMLAVGFGASVFVIFLIPFGAVLIMPAAVAGGTLLARELVARDQEPDSRLRRSL